MELRFEKTIAECGMDAIMIERGTVIAAYSGGADSSCLLRMLDVWCRENGVRLCACHLNHMIRGESADRDEAFCAAECSGLGIEFHSERIDVPALAERCGMGLEEAAREARYRFFDDVSEKLTGRRGGAVVATAHNSDDNLETVILNMVRGSGLKGMCGIPPVRDGRFIRPLLNDSSASIRAWCSENGVGYVEDETNESTEYSRNRVRRLIVPELRNLSDDPEKAVSRMCALLRSDEDFLSSEASGHVLADGVSAAVGDLKRLHPAVLSRVFRILYSNCTGGCENLSSLHIESLSKALGGDSVNSEVTLPGGVSAVFDREKVRFAARDGENAPYDTGVTECAPGDTVDNELFAMSFSLEDAGGNEKNDDSFINIYNSYIQTVLDFDKIKGTLRIRLRAEGDTYRIRGVNRKVRKLFNEKKITPYDRARLPVVLDDSGIIWIPGFPPRDGLAAGSKDCRRLTVRYVRK